MHMQCGIRIKIQNIGISIISKRVIGKRNLLIEDINLTPLNFNNPVKKKISFFNTEIFRIFNPNNMNKWYYK